jgi:hypothetical protein
VQFLRSLGFCSRSEILLPFIMQVTVFWDVAYCYHLKPSWFCCRSNVSLRTYVLLHNVLYQHLFVYANDYGSSLEY